MNIYEKMSAITNEITAVAKNLEVELPNGKGYKAVSEPDVLKAVKPIEAKFGVYSYPVKREIVESGEIITTTKYGEKKNLFVRVEVIYRFVNIEKPEEYVEVFSYGDGVDSQDKAAGKAMTYADKYALLKAYKIITGDDADQEHSPDRANYTEKQTTESKATPKQIELLSKLYTGENLVKLLQANNITKIEDLSLKKASEIIAKINKKGT